jgi:hypothetical protein
MRAKVKEAIEEVVRERLTGTDIVDVQVTEDTDCEGDTVYRVTVIYDAAKGRLDSAKTASLARYTRSRLANRDAFPLFSFISRSDLKRTRAAAA